MSEQDDNEALEQVSRASRHMDQLIAIAEGRYLEETNFDFRDHLTPEELAEYDEAEDTVRQVGRVVIEVTGQAQIVRNPLDIEVEFVHLDDPK